MARVMKHQKLVNPAKRHLSLKQKLHFGTSRQRVAAKLALRSRGKPKRKTLHRKVTRENPIGTIITLGMNPGKVGNMKRRRRNSSKRRATPRRNPVVRRRRRVARRSNPFTVVHHRLRSRRRNPSRVVYASRRRRFNPRRRRNPDLRSTGTKVLGIIGGAALTKLVTAMLPASFQTGILKYIGTGIVALGLGWGVNKFGHSPTLAENVTAGGLTLLGLEILSDLVPGIAAYSGLSVSGMGNVLASSSFYSPQVNSGNSMTRFITPAGVTMAMPAISAKKGLKGMGRLAVPRGGWQ